MSDDQYFEAAMKRVEETAALNAQGLAVKQWRPNNDDFEWVYGGLAMPDSHSLRIKLGVTDDSTTPWSTLKAAIVTIRQEKRSR